MKERESIIQQFSTFISLINDNKNFNFIWKIDIHLERNISLLVQSEPDANEEYWARHFLKIIRELSKQELFEKKENLYVSIAIAIMVRT
ncbi:hypothetical protein [Nostoc sp.]|uniref:hypothetical protein n=1 Tax=Nostoc sp. TaxID=1180 RepID=UPI002FF5F013